MIWLFITLGVLVAVVIVAALIILVIGTNQILRSIPISDRDYVRRLTQKEAKPNDKKINNGGTTSRET